MANRRRSLSEDIVIDTAQTTPLGTPEQVGRHLDDEIARKAECHIARSGYLHNEHIKASRRAVPSITTSNFGAHRKYLAEYSSDAQCATIKYSRTTSCYLVDATSGNDAWRAAPTEQQRNMVIYLFSQFPLTCCKNMFHLENNVACLENIWAVDNETTVRWQRFFKLVFVALMLKAVQHHALLRHAPQNEMTVGLAEIYLHWKIVKLLSKFDVLGLGTLQDVPIRQSRMEADARPLAIVAEDDDMVLLQ